MTQSGPLLTQPMTSDESRKPKPINDRRKTGRTEDYCMPLLKAVILILKTEETQLAWAPMIEAGPDGLTIDGYNATNQAVMKWRKPWKASNESERTN